MVLCDGKITKKQTSDFPFILSMREKTDVIRKVWPFPGGKLIKFEHCKLLTYIQVVL